MIIDDCCIIGRTAVKDLECFSTDEKAISRERVEWEKNNAILKHEMKEIQRKLETESDLRLKSEEKIASTKHQLQAETRTRMEVMNNSTQQISQLEKQVKYKNN